MIVTKTPSPMLQRFWTLLLVMCLIQFSAVWVYPPSTSALFENVNIDKYMGLPFQWTVWALVCIGLLIHVQRFGFGQIFRAINIFLPFWLVGMVAGVFGFNPFSSTRLMALWSLMAIAASILGAEMPAERGSKVLCISLLCFMLLSVVLSVALPSVGTQVYGFTKVWRGAFVSKNTLGWIAALTLVVSVSLLARENRRWPIGAALLALTCLVGSGSKGALVAALATLAYLYIVKKLSSRVTPGFGVAVILFLMVVAGLCAFLVLPLVLEALGRDATLTGRTDVWSTYFFAMVNTPWLGDGPGAYTALSPLTLPLANKLAELGTIVTPHNIFLGVLGDSGMFGLLAFVGVMGYLTLVLPMKRPSRFVTACSAIGFLVVAHGMVETHEVFIPGLATFMLIFYRALDMREQQPTADKRTSSYEGRSGTMPLRYSGPTG